MMGEVWENARRPAVRRDLEFLQSDRKGRAEEVSLAREPPGRSSILNVLPAQIVAANTLNAYEVLAAVALGEDGAGARLLARVPQKSWEELGFAQGQNVFAQVKSVALGRANMRE